MNTATELAALFRRDLTRLMQELEAFPNDQAVWQTQPGVTNSAGNLALHLEGNLREYVGRQLGGVAYVRQRDQEFSGKGVSAADLVARISEVREIVPRAIAALTAAQWDAVAAEKIGGKTVCSNGQFLLHLFGHFSYHLGQIDYLRRMLTSGQAVDFAGL